MTGQKVMNCTVTCVLLRQSAAVLPQSNSWELPLPIGPCLYVQSAARALSTQGDGGQHVLLLIIYQIFALPYYMVFSLTSLSKLGWNLLEPYRSCLT